MQGFERKDGALLVDGLSVAALADQFGTPSYIYSGAQLLANYRQFAKAISGLDCQIHFAVKANSALGVISLLAGAGAGADIVSGGELERALRAGVAAEKIIFSGVGKQDAEIAAALRAGIGQINAESAAEIDRISLVAEQMGCIAPVALRVNVNVDPGSHAKISTGQASTKFGIPTADGQAAHLYRRISADPHIRAAGLAVHIGSQIRDLAPFEAAYTALLSLAEQLQEEGLEVPGLDLGGGLGVDYQQSQPTDFAGYGALVTRLFGNRGYRLGFEPGRSITADAGILLTRTLYIKPGDDKQFVIVDAAMNDLLRPTLYEAFHLIEPVAEKLASAPVGLVDIVGPVCETGDYLALGREMGQLARDDLLAVFGAGAYGAVMASTYNTRPEAAEILVVDGTAHCLRPRRSLDDLLAAEINPLV